MSSRPTIGIIGAGRLGTAIARRFSLEGYEVKIANSRSPETLIMQLNMLVPNTRAVASEVAAKDSDVVFLAIPLHNYKALNPNWFKGKIVVDAMNYWPPTEGEIEEFSGKLSSSEVIQAYMSEARVVKSFNHIAYNELDRDAEKSPRRAMGLAGNDVEAKEVISRLITDAGFEPVDLGDLKNGSRLQPDMPLFNNPLTAEEMLSHT